MVAAILVEEGKIDILKKNAEGKCAFEIAINSEMKAACEPYVASTSSQLCNPPIDYGFLVDTRHDQVMTEEAAHFAPPMGSLSCLNTPTKERTLTTNTFDRDR